MHNITERTILTSPAKLVSSATYPQAPRPYVLIPNCSCNFLTEHSFRSHRTQYPVMLKI